jgi:hypothetical protein
VKAALFVCLIALAVPCVAAAGDSPNPAASACKDERQQVGVDAFATKYGVGDAGIRACVAAHGTTIATPPTPVASELEDSCKAEYARIGADAFKAKYGASEPYQACKKGDTGGGTTPPSKPADPPAPDSKGDGGTNPPPTTVPTKPVEPTGPEAACKAELARLGEAAFKEKYGAKEAFGACVKGVAVAKTPPAADVATSLAKSVCAAKLKVSAKERASGKVRFAACVAAALPKLRDLVARCKASSGDDMPAFKQCLVFGTKIARAR